MPVILYAFLISKSSWKKRTKCDVFFHAYSATQSTTLCFIWPEILVIWSNAGGKESCHDVWYISEIKRFRSLRWHQCFYLVCLSHLNCSAPQGEHVILPNPTQCKVQKPFLHILHTCLWFTEQVTSPACLNSCFIDDPPPLPSPSS